MATSRRTWLLGLGSVLCLLATTAEGQTEAELAVIANPACKLTAADTNFLEGVFTTTQAYWPAGTRIVAFNLSPGSALRVEFDRAVLGMGPDEVGRYWVDRKIRGGAPPPHQVPDPAIAVRVVARLDGAIAYVPAQVVDASVRVIARVKHGKVVRP